MDTGQVEVSRLNITFRYLAVGVLSVFFAVRIGFSFYSLYRGTVFARKSIVTYRGNPTGDLGEWRRRHEIKRDGGILINTYMDLSGPAEDVGLMPGDLITHIGGLNIAEDPAG